VVAGALAGVFVVTQAGAAPASAGTVTVTVSGHVIGPAEITDTRDLGSLSQLDVGEVDCDQEAGLPHGGEPRRSESIKAVAFAVPRLAGTET
jgi:hypothetical protein